MLRFLEQLHYQFTHYLPSGGGKRFMEKLKQNISTSGVLDL